MADDLELTHSATVSADYKEHSAFFAMTRVNDTLAIDKNKAGKTTRIFIHGNIKITVRRGAEDVGKYAIRRAMRMWTAPLDPGPPDSRTGAYTLDSGDFHTDSGGKPLGEWHDSPGIPQGIKIVKTARLYYEWVIGCENREHALVPNLRGLYFTMLLDLTPSLYKIAYSKAWGLPAQQVKDILENGGVGPIPVGEPWKPEDTLLQSDDWVDRTPGWLSYEVHNNQLVPPAP